MGESTAAVHALVDMELGSVILANMLAGWLDGNRESSFSVEAANEYHDQRATPEQERLCVCASVDAGASPPPSGEHRTPICPEGEGSGTGLERAGSTDSEPVLWASQEHR